jgi:hypothetical protein
VIGSSTASVITEFVLPSNSRSGIGSTEWVQILYLITNADSMNQWVDPESTWVLFYGLGQGMITNLLQENSEKRERKH